MKKQKKKNYLLPETNFFDSKIIWVKLINFVNLSNGFN